MQASALYYILNQLLKAFVGAHLGELALRCMFITVKRRFDKFIRISQTGLLINLCIFIYAF